MSGDRRPGKLPPRPIILWTEFLLVLVACSPRGSEPPLSPIPLDISCKVSQPEESMPHRRTAFGLNAKRKLMRIGGAYDTVDPTPFHYVFLTGTIPGGTHDAFMAMARESRYVVKALSDWFSRSYPTPYWFYVWELQARGALHIHYCVYAPNPRIRADILCKWHEKWHSIIQEVGRRSDADMWKRKDGTYHREGHSVLQAYAQEVNKSVAAYLAGYCGGSKDKHSTDASSPYYPGRWWGASRASIKLLESLTKEVTVDYANYREADRDMRVIKEALSTSTDHLYEYPHKAGVGRTIVSYHPEDKGKQVWTQLTGPSMNPTLYPNACSWIAALETYMRICTSYLKTSPKHKGIASQRLLQDCEGIISEGSLTAYTLHHTTIQTVRRLQSVYSLNTLLKSGQGQITSVCVSAIWMLEQVYPLLRWDRNGLLALESDLPVQLTNCWVYTTIGTNGSEGTASDSLHGEPQPSCLPIPTQISLFD